MCGLEPTRHLPPLQACVGLGQKQVAVQEAPVAQIGLHMPLPLHECVPSGQWQVAVHWVPVGHTACGAGLGEVGDDT